MLTQQQLAALLWEVPNVEALAKQTGVSSKTIRRIREGKNAPTLTTVHKLLPALKPPKKGRK